MFSKLALTLVAAATVMAGAQSLTAKDQYGRESKDPNEWICEKQTIIGTRLATRRVCATRAEWEEKRRQDKDAIDKAQTQIGVIKI